MDRARQRGAPAVRAGPGDRVGRPRPGPLHRRSHGPVPRGRGCPGARGTPRLGRRVSTRPSHVWATAPWGRSRCASIPAVPALTHAVAWLPGVGDGTALLVVSNVAAYVATVLLYILVRRETRNGLVARRAIWFLSLAPAAYVLVMGYAESTLLCLAVGCFLALRRSRAQAPMLTPSRSRKQPSDGTLPDVGRWPNRCTWPGRPVRPIRRMRERRRGPPACRRMGPCRPTSSWPACWRSWRRSPARSVCSWPWPWRSNCCGGGPGCVAAAVWPVWAPPWPRWSDWPPSASGRGTRSATSGPL